jgi:hypothetical protein
MAQAGRIQPRFINVDGHPAYPAAVANLKRSGELGRRCLCRRSPYMNNILEQDHQFVKKRVVASQWFRSVDGALNTIAGYEAMNIIRKGQIRWCRRRTLLAKYTLSNAPSASPRSFRRGSQSRTFLRECLRHYPGSCFRSCRR